jgi:hypothetical protein
MDTSRVIMCSDLQLGLVIVVAIVIVFTLLYFISLPSSGVNSVIHALNSLSLCILLFNRSLRGQVTVIGDVIPLRPAYSTSGSFDTKKPYPSCVMRLIRRLTRCLLNHHPSRVVARVESVSVFDSLINTPRQNSGIKLLESSSMRLKR